MQYFSRNSTWQIITVSVNFFIFYFFFSLAEVFFNFPICPLKKKYPQQMLNNNSRHSSGGQAWTVSAQCHPIRTQQIHFLSLHCPCQVTLTCKWDVTEPMQMHWHWDLWTLTFCIIYKPTKQLLLTLIHSLLSSLSQFLLSLFCCWFFFNRGQQLQGKDGSTKHWTSLF